MLARFFEVLAEGERQGEVNAFPGRKCLETGGARSLAQVLGGAREFLAIDLDPRFKIRGAMRCEL